MKITLLFALFLSSITTFAQQMPTTQDFAKQTAVQLYALWWFSGNGMASSGLFTPGTAGIVNLTYHLPNKVE